MALFLFSAGLVSRKSKNDRAGIEAAVYQSGQPIRDRCDGKVYSHERNDVYHAEILLADNAPPEFLDRETFWNAVEMREDRSTRRKDAQTARSIVLALQQELPLDRQIELVVKYAKDTFVRQGMCADVAVHLGKNPDDPAKDNPHVHILLTTRFVGPEGFGLKNRDWNDWQKNNKLFERWKEDWAKILNHEFMIENKLARVAYKSHKRRGDIEYQPTYHLGPTLSAMERRGIKTRLGDVNRAIEAERRLKQQEHQRELELTRDYERERGR